MNFDRWAPCGSGCCGGHCFSSRGLLIVIDDYTRVSLDADASQINQCSCAMFYYRSLPNTSAWPTIANYVENGGRVCFFGEYYSAMLDYPPDPTRYYDPSNAFLTALGSAIQFGYDALDAGTVWDVGSMNPINLVSGITQIYHGGTNSLTGGGTTVATTVDNPAKVFVAIEQIGLGYVLVFGDSQPASYNETLLQRFIELEDPI